MGRNGKRIGPRRQAIAPMFAQPGRQFAVNVP